MEAFRLSREKFAVPLSGKGASIKGARWNSIGVEMVYTAANRSLALAEVAVHLTIATLPDDYVMMTLHLPDDLPLKKLNIKDLPANWNAFPQNPATQALGDAFIRNGKQAVLQVPSVVTQGDYNLLLNPYHPDFKRIKVVSVVPFPFDVRLFQ